MDAFFISKIRCNKNDKNSVNFFMLLRHFSQAVGGGRQHRRNRGRSSGLTPIISIQKESNNLGQMKCQMDFLFYAFVRQKVLRHECKQT
jgi:hypothetical protein